MNGRPVILFSIAIGFVLTTRGALAGVAIPVAGWETNSSWSGVNGYIDQSLTGSTSGWHSAHIGIDQDPAHWVEVGTYQGVHAGQGGFGGLNSPGAVHVFEENYDACGDYHLDDRGAPASANFPYSVNWDGKAETVSVCRNGSHMYGYTYPVRKGGVTTTPFYNATLQVSSGVIYAKTELQDNPPEGFDWFGCTGTHTCYTSAYGIHLYNGSTWVLWGSSTATSGETDPPWLFTYNYHWSFKTCPTLSCP
jgi:hypothetical protein